MWNSEVGWSGGQGAWSVPRGPGVAGEARSGRRWPGAVSPSWLLKGLALVSLLAVVVAYMDDEAPENGPEDGSATVRIMLGRPSHRLTSFAMSPDGTLVAVSHDINQRRVSLWSLEGQGVRPRYLTFEGPIWCLAFSPDGRFLAAGGEGRDVAVVDLSKKHVRRVLRTPWTMIKSLAFSPAGDRLAVSTRASGEIGVWDLATERAGTMLRGRGPALDMQFAPDGRSLVVGELDDVRVTLWDLETGRPRVLGERPGGGAVRSVAFSADGRLLAAFGYWENEVRLRDAASGRLVRSISVGGERPHAVAFAPDGKHIVVGTGHGTIVLYDLETCGVAGRFESRMMSPKLAFSDTRRSLVVVGDDANELALWRVPATERERPRAPDRSETVAVDGPDPSGKRGRS